MACVLACKERFMLYKYILLIATNEKDIAKRLKDIYGTIQQYIQLDISVKNKASVFIASSRICPLQSDSGGSSDEVNLNFPQVPYYPWDCAAISSGRHQSDSGGVYLYW